MPKKPKNPIKRDKMGRITVTTAEKFVRFKELEERFVTGWSHHDLKTYLIDKYEYSARGAQSFIEQFHKYNAKNYQEDREKARAKHIKMAEYLYKTAILHGELAVAATVLRQLGKLLGTERAQEIRNDNQLQITISDYSDPKNKAIDVTEATLLDNKKLTDGKKP